MSGSLGKSESDNSNQANFSQDVWGPQGQALQNMYGQIGNLFGQSQQQQQNLVPGAVQQQQGVFDDSNAAYQNQLQGGAYAGMDTQGNYQNALQGGGNEQFIDQSIMGGQGNNYVDAMQGQMVDRSQQALGRNLASNDARAAGTGLSGSSRHGIVEQGIRDSSSADLANQQTQLGFNTFDRDLDRKLGIAQRADQFDMNRLNNASGMLQNQNQAMQGGLNFGQNQQQLGMGQFAPSMAPWQSAQAYGGLLGGPQVLGSGSGSGSGSSKGFGASGGVKS